PARRSRERSANSGRGPKARVRPWTLNRTVMRGPARGAGKQKGRPRGVPCYCSQKRGGGARAVGTAVRKAEDAQGENAEKGVRCRRSHLFSVCGKTKPPVTDTEKNDEQVPAGPGLGSRPVDRPGAAPGARFRQAAAGSPGQPRPV